MNQLSKEKRLNLFRKILIFWTLFIGLGAIAGGIGMEVDPSGKVLGMDQMLPYFKVLPFASSLFQDLVFPGIALIIVNGISNLTASVFLFLKKKTGYILGLIFGITLMMWICIQFVILPVNFLSTIYFFFGLFQAITGVACLIFLKQTKFVFNKEDYKNIKEDSKTIVLYFSRMGYVRKKAYEIADSLSSSIEEIFTPENTSNTLGF